MTRFLVTVTNEVLGNSNRIMTYDEIKNFNVVAFSLAQRALKRKIEQSSGMWTVEVLNDTYP